MSVHRSCKPMLIADTSVRTMLEVRSRTSLLFRSCRLAHTRLPAECFQPLSRKRKRAVVSDRPSKRFRKTPLSEVSTDSESTDHSMILYAVRLSLTVQYTRSRIQLTRKRKQTVVSEDQPRKRFRKQIQPQPIPDVSRDTCLCTSLFFPSRPVRSVAHTPA